MNQFPTWLGICSVCCLIAGCDAHCDLILRNVPGKGIGVFAGRDWFPQELLELTVGIPISYESVYWTQLINYCEGYNESHALLTLGYSMLYNHIFEAEQSMVQKHMSRKPGIARFTRTSELSSDIFFEPNSIVFAGEEILSHYGDNYFTDRDMVELEYYSSSNSIVLDRETTALDILQAQNHPHNLPGCPLQLTEYVDGALHAMVDIKAGAYIEVVRALLIPDWATVHAGPLKEFLWRKATAINEPLYAMSRNGAPEGVEEDYNLNLPTTAQLYKIFGSPYNVATYSPTNTTYALLLTGHGALYSSSKIICADTSTCGVIEDKEVNVVYDWWRGEEASSDAVHCDLAMLVSFRAFRDIRRGEELVVDLSVQASSLVKFPSAAFANVCL